MKLSIIIPVFNESKTIGSVIDAVENVKLENTEKEIIVVDDGSTDGTRETIEEKKKKLKDLVLVKHRRNLGKGSAVISGIAEAKGDYILIQDADLEYNPQDIQKLLIPLRSGKNNVVYGTRLKRLPNFERDERTLQFLSHYIGNKFLSLITSILYGQWITDMETGYKLIPRIFLKDIVLKARGFELEPEITAKLLKNKYIIIEIPISTNPRGYKEGKKLNTITDGFKALWTLMKYRVID